jgi:hypothetical protein
VVRQRLARLLPHVLFPHYNKGGPLEHLCACLCVCVCVFFFFSLHLPMLAELSCFSHAAHTRRRPCFASSTPCCRSSGAWPEPVRALFLQLRLVCRAGVSWSLCRHSVFISSLNISDTVSASNGRSHRPPLIISNPSAIPFSCSWAAIWASRLNENAARCCELSRAKFGVTLYFVASRVRVCLCEAFPRDGGRLSQIS